MRIKMKYSSFIGVLPFVVASCGPSGATRVATVDPVPHGLEITSGVLKVYTPTEELSSEGPVYYEGYRILSCDGSVLREVYSNGTIDLSNQQPRSIQVPVGKYLVEAHSDNASWVRVPVVVEEGQLTVVDLQQHSSRSL